MDDRLAGLAWAIDGTAIVPGSPSAVRTAAEQVGVIADGLAQAQSGYRNLDPEHWQGQAADAFHDAFEPQPRKLRFAAEAMTEAHTALTVWADDLEAAQQDAYAAACRYQHAAMVTAEAKAAHEVAVDQARATQAAALVTGIPVVVPMPQFTDPGAAERAAAVQAAREAIDFADGAADVCARAVRAATEDAPQVHHHWWDGVTSTVSSAAHAVGHAGEDSWDWTHDHVVRPVVNGGADVGRAAYHDPGDVAKMALGTAMMAGGTGMVVAGGGLDLTVAGAAAGIPLSIAGLGVAASGVGLAGQGASGFGQQVGREDANIMHASSRRRFGSGNGPHTAKVTVTRGGEKVFDETFTSGNMTPEERALGFPKMTLATHTEIRALAAAELRPGDTMEFEGTLEACRNCKGAMNAAVRRTGAQIIYRWPGGEWVAKG